MWSLANDCISSGIQLNGRGQAQSRLAETLCMLMRIASVTHYSPAEDVVCSWG